MLGIFFTLNFSTMTFQPLHYIVEEFMVKKSGVEAWGRDMQYAYRVLQTFQMKLILLCVWAELAVLGSTETAPKFKYEI